MRMYKLPMVVDLSSEVGVIFIRGFEYNLTAISAAIGFEISTLQQLTFEPFVSLCVAR
jgi:uncharacterized protein (UPF0216 family)